MKSITPEAVQGRLDRFAGRELYLHLETTGGMYTKGAHSAFVRNATIRVRRALLTGDGPYRIGVETDSGWVYADGLTHWELDGGERLLMAGVDEEGKLAVAVELGEEPFPGPGGAGVQRGDTGRGE